MTASIPEESKERPIAEESNGIQKARKKLQEQWEKEKLLFTKEALEKTACSIRDWIAAHQSARVYIPGKGLSLFTANEAAAKASRKVTELMERLKTQTIPN